MRDERVRRSLQYAGIWPIRPPNSAAARRLLRSPAWYVNELVASLREQGHACPPALPLVPFHSQEGEPVRLTYPLGYMWGIISSPVKWRWEADGGVRLVHHPRLLTAAGTTIGPKISREGTEVRPQKTLPSKTAAKKSGAQFDRMLKGVLNRIMPGEKKEWSARCVRELWQDSDALSEREIVNSFQGVTANVATANATSDHSLAAAVFAQDAGTITSRSSAAALSTQDAGAKLSEAQTAKVRRYVQLQVPFAVFRFLAFFARQAGMWMPGTWGRSYVANLVREFDRREQHFLAQEESIHKECQSLSRSAAVAPCRTMAENAVTRDDDVTVGVVAGICFVVEHCSYELITRFLIPGRLLTCYVAADLGATAARMARAFLDATAELPEGASMVRGSRFTMPVASIKAQLSWEGSPVGEDLSQAHTYAWLLEKLVSGPPAPMQQGAYLAAHSHMAERIGPFYAQLTLCHFLLPRTSSSAWMRDCLADSESLRARHDGPAERLGNSTWAPL